MFFLLLLFVYFCNILSIYVANAQKVWELKNVCVNSNSKRVELEVVPNDFFDQFLGFSNIYFVFDSQMLHDPCTTVFFNIQIFRKQFKIQHVYENLLLDSLESSKFHFNRKGNSALIFDFIVAKKTVFFFFFFAFLHFFCKKVLKIFQLVRYNLTNLYLFQ